jgi:hypothetical protein
MNEWGTGEPEYAGNYLVTTKSTGTVCMRRFDGFKWLFGAPLAWMYPPAPYEAAQAGEGEADGA